MAAAKGRCRFLTINNSWLLAPWADVLYGCDFIWWDEYAGVPDFPGLKISQDKQCQQRPWGIKRVEVEKGKDRLLVSEFGTIGWGGNSGFHALNLAVQFGVKKIILVGYDMRLDRGLHWHGKHPQRLNNPNARNVERWCRAVDGTAEMLKALGVEVINTSSVSALRNFQKMGFAEALEC